MIGWPSKGHSTVQVGIVLRTLLLSLACVLLVPKMFKTINFCVVKSLEENWSGQKGKVLLNSCKGGADDMCDVVQEIE